MKSIQILLLAAVMLLTSMAQAAPPVLSDEQMATIAGTMFKAYKEGGTPKMFAVEIKCWEDASKTRRAEMSMVAKCATAAMSGAFIEAAYARQQMRSSIPEYSGVGIRDRITELSGLNPDELQSLSDDTLRPGVRAMMNGLVRAGMR